MYSLTHTIKCGVLRVAQVQSIKTSQQMLSEARASCQSDSECRNAQVSSSTRESFRGQVYHIRFGEAPKMSNTTTEMHRIYRPLTYFAHRMI